jgi:hypothetical protein
MSVVVDFDKEAVRQVVRVDTILLLTAAGQEVIRVENSRWLALVGQFERPTPYSTY